MGLISRYPNFGRILSIGRRMCAKGRYSYTLYDGRNVLKLNDQKTPAKFVAQKVKVTGALDEKNKTIKVSSIEPIANK